MKNLVSAYLIDDGIVIMGIEKDGFMNEYSLGRINNFENNKKENSIERMKSFYTKVKKTYQKIELKKEKYLALGSFEYFN